MFLHLFSAAEYLGMSGKTAKKFPEVWIMCNNNFCGNYWWIIILILLFCNCGGSMWSGNNCGCGCETDRCGCC